MIDLLVVEDFAQYMDCVIASNEFPSGNLTEIFRGDSRHCTQVVIAGTQRQVAISNKHYTHIHPPPPFCFIIPLVRIMADGLAADCDVDHFPHITMGSTGITLCHGLAVFFCAVVQKRGSWVFISRGGGGGGDRAPKNWGRGREKGSVDRTIVMNSGATGTENFLEHWKWSIFFSPNTWQTMPFLNPLDALIPQIPFSFFAEFWIRVTSGGQSR